MKSVTRFLGAVWAVPEAQPEVEAGIAAALGCSRVLAGLLANRGVRTPEEADSFLRMRMADLVPPDRFRDMPIAVARIRRALAQREKIAIFGDYDVDGITATAILLLLLRRLDANVRAFLPHRVNEGYGLSNSGIQRMHAWGAQLVITVDNGIASAEQVAQGAGLGMDFIVTDHHEAAERIPRDVPILNPKLPGETYPFRDLAGAGVALKLAWGLARELSGRTKVTAEFRELLLRFVALASLGTIADVVPLVGENRILAHHGLRILHDLDSPGLRALRAKACRNSDVLTAHHIAFRLGPRLNAAGRLGDAGRALELLITEDPDRAMALALELDRENDRRRRIEQQILSEAHEDAEKARRSDEPCIVLACDRWHVGVLGIAAARLAEEFERPAVLIALDGGYGRGSGRSAGGVALHEIISQSSDLLEGFGGHAEACGLRIRADQVAPFASRLREAIRKRYPVLRDVCAADMVLAPGELTRGILQECARLAPFGEGNRPPCFIAQDLEVVGEPRLMGQSGTHLAFVVRSGGATYRAVHFGGARDLERTRRPVTFAYEPMANTYAGADEVELRIKRMF